LKIRILAVVLTILAAHSAIAACLNRYVAQRDGAKNTVTILTGRITYTEAFERVQAVSNGAAAPEWVDENGKTIMKLVNLKVIRPMPVSCDEKTTGVVLSTTFLSPRAVTGRIYIKFDEKNTVALDQQGP
jgi:hypothetical protein